jgi:hypothetical protein
VLQIDSGNVEHTEIELVDFVKHGIQQTGVQGNSPAVIDFEGVLKTRQVVGRECHRFDRDQKPQRQLADSVHRPPGVGFFRDAGWSQEPLVQLDCMPWVRMLLVHGLALAFALVRVLP